MAAQQAGQAAGVALAAVAASNFMVQLAMMPVSTILPTLAGHFGVDAATVSWVMTSYLLSLSGLVLASGRLGDQYGHRRLFIIGIGIFTAGAVAAGLAPTLLTMIGARVVQGVGAAFMMGSALALIAHHVPARQRGRAIGLAAVAASVGSLVGVAIGSFLFNQLSWHWVFLAVAPAGVLTFLLALRLPADRPAVGLRARPDLLGSALLFLMLTSLSLSFTHLHDGAASFEAGWPYHTAMQGLTATLLAAFIVVEARARNPMVPLALFRHRRFTCAILANGALHMTMMGSMFLVPFLVEQGMGRPPATTGLLLVPMQLAGMGASYAGGLLYDRTRSRWLAPLALVGIGLGLGLLGFAGPELSEVGIGLLLVGVGASTSMFMTANNTAALGALPERLGGFSAGMLETSRQLGHSVAVALAGGVLGLVAEQALAGTGGPEAATRGFSLAILSFSLVAFVGAGFALFGGERVLATRLAQGVGAGADD